MAAIPRAAAAEDISEQMAIETGTRVTSATAHGKHGHSLISDAKFRQLYELALKMQRAGEREERMRGREAAMAAVAADLQGSDAVVAEFAGSVDDIARGHVTVRMERRSFEERVIEALSDAVGDRMRKTGRITAIFFDGTENSKVMQEARALAIAAKLPVLLVEHLSTKGQTRQVEEEGEEDRGARVSVHPGGGAGCDRDVPGSARIDCAGAGGERSHTHCERAVATGG